MEKKKIIIVGGVAGGATSAARLRRLDESSEIIIFERGEYVSFANCGLPYYIGDVIKKRSSLLVQTISGMKNRFNIDIRNFSEVTKIDSETKTVTVHNLSTNDVYTESYDKLILSPGAKPFIPTIPGLDDAKEKVFTLRNIPDTDRIYDFISKENPRNAVVIGGGFIGLEMAENLSERGLEVTIVEMANQVMAPLDFEMAKIIHHHLGQMGIKLILEDGVKSFSENGKSIDLNSGTTLQTDMIILSIGVQPESSLAIEAGLEVGPRKTIIVNKHLQTSQPDIYAIGDAIEVNDYINGKPTYIPLAWPANRQGHLVADHINGMQVDYKGTLGTAVAKVFELTVASTGNNEKTLKRVETPYETIHIHPNSHANYYPGASQINLKLLFSPTDGKILGAQAIGALGVEKRIDVIATAIKGGLTVFDLADLELSYAPPYSSAKDPVNMAGYTAINLISGLTKTIQWHEINEFSENKGFIVDVREPAELEKGFIKGSINIPLGQLRSRLEELPTDQPVAVVCQVGLRGYIATRILLQNGIDARNLDGGYVTYSYVFNEIIYNKNNVKIDDSGVAEIND
jgi:CoA-disulfide reductase